MLRELKEETNLSGRDPLLVTVAGNPGRDPRKHVVSIMYYVTVDVRTTRSLICVAGSFLSDAFVVFYLIPRSTSLQHTLLTLRRS